MSKQQRQIRQQAGTVEENPVRLDRGKAEQVVEALNADLAASYVLYHQLRKHHWNVAGAQYRELHLFWGEAAEDAEENADELAERVQALGGVPVSGPAALERHSPIPFEGEDVYDVRTSLENDLDAYGDVIESVSSHIELAESLGDHATAEILREQLVGIEEYAHEVDHFLAHDSLTLW
ncbi:DNA starvation/stationary phase protection protein [Halorussus salilacus]|uniref:DNA starvation/stationary phase protection protein DpsA n=1 Tax=Halorussus salilacus TaxID=2953750 RepID=UPI0020A22EF6|nr:DNA starvation/stationary phase protection protein DpsA [Halorussus salilacus]USZ68402.1 DNA starvation/stationary phase protection protein [Halorussus salilacus]